MNGVNMFIIWEYMGVFRSNGRQGPVVHSAVGLYHQMCNAPQGVDGKKVSCAVSWSHKGQKNESEDPQYDQSCFLGGGLGGTCTPLTTMSEETGECRYKWYFRLCSPHSLTFHTSHNKVWNLYLFVRELAVRLWSSSTSSASASSCKQSSTYISLNSSFQN